MGLFAWVIRISCLVLFLAFAVRIRLFAVEKYGPVIHEFDPWFNFRATEYMARNGYSKFVEWFDYESWYPIGRPVGTTTYPGMMITAAEIWHVLEFFDAGISLNDVCVFIPAGFAVIACLFLGLSMWEISGSVDAALAATGIFAIIPAHLMRSVAGGFDNESVAVSAICSTFYFWIRSLRNSGSWKWSFLTAFSYIYMVAAWGAYPFVLNMIGVHCGVLALIEFMNHRFDNNLHLSYSIFFVIGTIGALQFPIVGTLPLKSMEQIAPLALFFGLQFLFGLHWYRKHKNMDEVEFKQFQLRAFGFGAVAGLVILVLLPSGYFGPLGARIRGLFVPHTRTGNPLVDSVAEHQATPNEAYWRYFHVVCLFAPAGVAQAFRSRTPAKWFLILYIFIAGYFSRKMIRLVLLLAPAMSMAAGWGLIFLVDWATSTLSAYFNESSASQPNATEKSGNVDATVINSPTRRSAVGTPGKKKEKKVSKAISQEQTISEAIEDTLSRLGDPKKIRAGVAAGLLAFMIFLLITANFISHSFTMAQHLSEPQIILQGRDRAGNPVMIDDFREAYFWLRDKTPTDARVMAWWDYGYQINGIGNRTSIADGNTWNHEHIALLGKCLVSDEEKAYSMVRHLADYVLVWSTRWGGMWGDDLAKMPHMGRIASSVYFDVEPHGYMIDQEGNPSELMKKSLLYILHSYRLDPRVPAPKHFSEVFTSSNRMVRIYKVENISQESKEYSAQHHTYSPALDHILAQANAFQREREKQYL